MLLKLKTRIQHKNSFNTCALMDASVCKIAHWCSSPDGEVHNCPRMPLNHTKQRSVHSGCKKFHGLSMLTIIHPNGMITVSSIVSARNWDRNMLTW